MNYRPVDKYSFNPWPSITAEHQAVIGVCWHYSLSKHYSPLIILRSWGNNVYEYSAFLLADMSSEDIMNILKKENIKQLNFISKDFADKLYAKRITSSEDNDDYIYKVEDWAILKSSFFRGKRNLYNRFIRFYPYLYAHNLDLESPNTINDVLNMYDIWISQRAYVTDYILKERGLIEYLLKNKDKVDIYIYGIYDQDQLISFTIYSLNKDYAFIHFDKIDKSYTGINEYMKCELAKYLRSINIEYINFEEDLGDEALRTYKYSWHPYKKIKNYTAIL